MRGAGEPPSAFCLFLFMWGSMRNPATIIAGLILLVTTAAEAMWTRLSNEELIDGSQVIVGATLQAGKDNLLELEGILVGTLRISRVYRGQVDGGWIYLKLPSKGEPISSNDLFYRDGQTGIWFLKEIESGSGIFYLDHPQRLWPLQREPLLLELLKQADTSGD